MIIAHAARGWKRGDCAWYRYQRFRKRCARRAICVMPLVDRGPGVAPAAGAEDGYDLWLSYQLMEEPWAGRY
jgi:hypothetical protein